MIPTKLANEIKEQLVKELAPEAIYVGPFYKNRDLEILVVVNKPKSSRYRIAVSGHLALRNLGIGKSILVYTKKEFAEEVNDQSSDCYDMKKYGKKIYAKA